MEKIKSLNSYQKAVLVFMIAMSFVFAVIYLKTISKVGFEYKDEILVHSQENGSTVYSGNIRGQEAQFTVSEDKTVVFKYGDKTYGPYTKKEDPTAIPDDIGMSIVTGVELREGDEILFRGAVLDMDDFYWLYSEDGTDYNIGITYVTSDGIERDENGNPIDTMKPTAANILKIMNDPELTHKGDGLAWFVAVLICIMNAASILFADELFHLSLSFRIRYAADAEPSEWEIIGRYIGWTGMTIVVLLIFITGLK